MKKSFLSKGFTLIELLVVIAIIGILAGIVLTSLNSARSKATDTKVQAQLASMRAQAELFYSGKGVNTYTDVCSDSDATSLKVLLAATTDSACYSTADAWAASGALKTGFYCVDSTGAARPISATLSNNVVVCPAS